MKSTPTSMKYIKIEEHGGPEVLKLDSMPVPEPGPGEVLIRVAAAGVNRPDVMQRKGLYPPPPGATAVPGLEVSGTVVSVGENVSEPAVGDEVCALVACGGYAEYCLASASICLPIPEKSHLRMQQEFLKLFSLSGLMSLNEDSSNPAKVCWFTVAAAVSAPPLFNSLKLLEQLFTPLPELRKNVIFVSSLEQMWQSITVNRISLKKLKN